MKWTFSGVFKPSVVCGRSWFCWATTIASSLRKLDRKVFEAEAKLWVRSDVVKM